MTVSSSFFVAFVTTNIEAEFLRSIWNSITFMSLFDLTHYL